MCLCFILDLIARMLAGGNGIAWPVPAKSSCPPRHIRCHLRQDDGLDPTLENTAGRLMCLGFIIGLLARLLHAQQPASTPPARAGLPSNVS